MRGGSSWPGKIENTRPSVAFFFQVSEDPYHHLALFTKRLGRETKRNDDDVDESSMDTYHHDQLANFLDQPVTPSPYDRCGWYSSESCNPCLFLFPSVSFLECTNHQRHHPLPSAILRVPVVHYRSTSSSYCAWWAHVGMNAASSASNVKNHWQPHVIIKRAKSIAKEIILSKWHVSMRI